MAETGIYRLMERNFHFTELMQIITFTHEIKQTPSD